MMQKAIFPLPIVLFPNGITRLRIFEQRYLRMVKQASGDIGFVISVFDKHHPDAISPFGSFVNITDFDQLEDGTLGISVQSQMLVTIGNTHQEKDNLHIGEVLAASHWPTPNLTPDQGELTDMLSEQLKALLAQNQQVGELYPQPNLNCPRWVCARWIELLPLNPTLKAMFYDPNSFTQAIELLSTVVLAQKATNQV